MKRKFIFVTVLTVLVILTASVVLAGGNGATGDKATGGCIGTYAGGTYQLEFNAIATADGAKGMVRWSGATGWFTGQVVAYQQWDNQASIIVMVTDAGDGLESWEYWNVNVKDGGEGANAAPDMFIARGYHTEPAPALLGCVAEVVEGNIQVH